MRADDRAIGVLPLFHIYGLTILMGSVCVTDRAHLCGCLLPRFTRRCTQKAEGTAARLVSQVLACRSTLVLVPKFDPVQFLDVMATDRISIGYLVPPILLFLASHPMVAGCETRSEPSSQPRHASIGATPVKAT